MQAVKCPLCNKEPKVKNIEGCFYAFCECTTYPTSIGPYSFLGRTHDMAIENWNKYYKDRKSKKRSKNVNN